MEVPIKEDSTPHIDAKRTRPSQDSTQAPPHDSSQPEKPLIPSESCHGNYKDTILSSELFAPVATDKVLIEQTTEDPLKTKAELDVTTKSKTTVARIKNRRISILKEWGIQEAPPHSSSQPEKPLARSETFHGFYKDDILATESLELVATDKVLEKQNTEDPLKTRSDLNVTKSKQGHAPHSFTTLNTEQDAKESIAQKSACKQSATLSVARIKGRRISILKERENEEAPPHHSFSSKLLKTSESSHDIYKDTTLGTKSLAPTSDSKQFAEESTAQNSEPCSVSRIKSRRISTSTKGGENVIAPLISKSNESIYLNKTNPVIFTTAQQNLDIKSTPCPIDVTTYNASMESLLEAASVPLPDVDVTDMEPKEITSETPSEFHSITNSSQDAPEEQVMKVSKKNQVMKRKIKKNLPQKEIGVKKIAQSLSLRKDEQTTVSAFKKPIKSPSNTIGQATESFGASSVQRIRRYSKVETHTPIISHTAAKRSLIDEDFTSENPIQNQSKRNFQSSTIDDLDYVQIENDLSDCSLPDADPMLSTKINSPNLYGATDPDDLRSYIKSLERVRTPETELSNPLEDKEEPCVLSQVQTRKRILKRKQTDLSKKSATEKKLPEELKGPFTPLVLLPVLPTIQTDYLPPVNNVSEPVSKVRVLSPPLHSFPEPTPQVQLVPATIDTISDPISQIYLSESTLSSNTFSFQTTHTPLHLEVQSNKPCFQNQLQQGMTMVSSSSKLQTQSSPSEPNTLYIASEPLMLEKPSTTLPNTAASIISTPPLTQSATIQPNYSPISNADENDEVANIFSGEQSFSTIRSSEDQNVRSPNNCNNPRSSPQQFCVSALDRIDFSRPQSIPQNIPEIPETDQVTLKTTATQTNLFGIINSSDFRSYSDIATQTHIESLQANADTSTDSSSSQMSENTSEEQENNLSKQVCPDDIPATSSSFIYPQFELQEFQHSNLDELSYTTMESETRKTVLSAPLHSSKPSTSQTGSPLITPVLLTSTSSIMHSITKPSIIHHDTQETNPVESNITIRSPEPSSNQSLLKSSTSVSSNLDEISNRLSQSVNRLKLSIQSRRRLRNQNEFNQIETPSKLMKNASGRTVNQSQLQDVAICLQSSSYKEGNGPHLSQNTELSTFNISSFLEPEHSIASGCYLKPLPLRPGIRTESQYFIPKDSCLPTRSHIEPIFLQSTTSSSEIPPLFGLEQLNPSSESLSEEPSVLQDSKPRRRCSLNQYDRQLTQMPSLSTIDPEFRLLRPMPSLLPISSPSPRIVSSVLQVFSRIRPQPTLTSELIQQFLDSMPPTPRDLPRLVHTFLQSLPDSLPPPPLAPPSFFSSGNSVSILENEFSMLTFPRESGDRREFSMPFQFASGQLDLAVHSARDTVAEVSENDERHRFFYSRADVARFRSLCFVPTSRVTLETLRNLGRRTAAGMRMYLLLLKFVVLYLILLTVCGYFGNVIAFLLQEVVNIGNRFFRRSE